MDHRGTKRNSDDKEAKLNNIRLKRSKTMDNLRSLEDQADSKNLNRTFTDLYLNSKEARGTAKEIAEGAMGSLKRRFPSLNLDVTTSDTEVPRKNEKLLTIDDENSPLHMGVRVRKPIDWSDEEAEAGRSDDEADLEILDKGSPGASSSDHKPKSSWQSTSLALRVIALGGAQK
jgi:hypothetical protein